MSFASDSFRTVFVRILMILLTLLSGIIHARWLGTDGVGVIALVLLLKNFFFQYGNLGFGSSFAYFLAQKQISLQRINQVNWLISLFLSTVSIAILLCIWTLPVSPWKHLDPMIFFISLIILPMFFMNTHNQRILSGRLKIAALNMVNLLNGLANLITLIVCVIVLKYGLIGAVLAIISGETVAFIYSNYQCYKLLKIEENNHCRSESILKTIRILWSYGRWNYLLSFANFLVQELPLMIFSSISGNTAAIGIFSKGRELGRQTRTLSIPIAQVLFPYTAASSQEKAVRRTNATCRMYLAFLTLVMLLAIPLVKPVIYLLFGQEFIPSAMIFYILIPGVIAWPLGNFLAIHIAAAGQPRIVFLYNLIPLVLSGFSGFVLIRLYDLTGMAMAVTLVLMVQSLIRFILYKKITGASISDVFLISKSDLHYMIETAKKWKKQ